MTCALGRWLLPLPLLMLLDEEELVEAPAAMALGGRACFLTSSA